MIAIRSLSSKLLALAPLAVALAGCTGAYEAPYQDASGAAELSRQLAGRVPGAPVNCLPSYRTNDSQVIDRDTILYRDGNTLYVQNTNGYCYPDGTGNGYTLVLRKYGTSDTCRGDVAQVINTGGGSFAGSCTFNDFIPYRPAGMRP